MQNNGVEVHEKRASRTLRRKPDDVLFCANRLWDHQSEHGFMLDVETAFQRVADKIVEGHQNLTQAEHFSITDFYLLWNLRERERSQAKTYPQLPSWKPERLVVDKDKQEQFEKLGVLYWNQDGEIPNRILTGTSLQIQLWAERERMEGTTWGIFRVRPGQGEFLVSDRLSLHSVVPISPELCLVAERRNRSVDFAFVARYNGLALENAESYYFARNIKNCPVLLRATLRDSLTRAGILKFDLTHD